MARAAATAAASSATRALLARHVTADAAASMAWTCPSRLPNPGMERRSTSWWCPSRTFHATRSVNARDYYDVVGVSKDASVSGIKKKALAGLRRINLEGLRWRVFDAKGQVLGRLASQIAVVLQGKDKPTYAPHVENGDMCIILNAKDIAVTGRKMTDKIYYWHTGYIGHLKERRLKDQMQRDPTEVIRKAVLRMLPRNRLRDDRDRKLRIFSGSEHPFHDHPLEPFVMPPRQIREMRPRARRALIRAQKREQANRAAGESAKDEEDNKTVKAKVKA